MKLRKHRDGTVSVRMTREQLQDWRFANEFAIAHWTDVVTKRHEPDANKRRLNREVLLDYREMSAEISAMCSMVKR